MLDSHFRISKFIYLIFPFQSNFSHYFYYLLIKSVGVRVGVWGCGTSLFRLSTYYSSYWIYFFMNYTSSFVDLHSDFNKIISSFYLKLISFNLEFSHLRCRLTAVWSLNFPLISFNYIFKSYLFFCRRFFSLIIYFFSSS